MLEKLMFLYVVVINIISFFYFGWDKRRAKNGGWRVPEKNLFIISIIGGSVGSLLGMKQFNHKEKKWYFSIGIPLILLIQLVVIFYFVFYRGK